MSRLKRWRQIGQGQFHKWETPGEEFEHVARDARRPLRPPWHPGDPDGLVTFPLHAALLERLKLVREGAEVLIRYTGKQTSKAGRIFKAFEVFVAGEDALRDTPELPHRLTVADELKPMAGILSEKPSARDPEYVLSAVVDAVGGVKAADREKQRAATIGTAIHAGIEWQLRTRLGEDAGPEPILPDAAGWAVESWKDWAKTIALEPLAIERTVYCEACGTLDLYARVEGALTVLDWKSGRAIYPEAFLQDVAYRHAAERRGLPSTQGLIVRVPKLVDDPSWEVMAVPDTLGLDDFLAAARLWRWQRQMEGKPVGDLNLGRPCHERDQSERMAAALP